MALVFTTAGILTFAAVNNTMILNLRGSQANSGNTLVGKILGPNNSEAWPENWNPDTQPVERDLGEEGFCQQLNEDGESCTEGHGTEG